MTIDKFNLRLNKQEKILLKKIVCKNGMTITDYIRQKVFCNNSDISDETIYECPAKNKRDYLNARMLQDIYMLLLHQIAEDKTTDETMAVKKRCRDHADANIAKFGYLKLEKNNKQ